MMASSSPEQTQRHDANEQQASTAYQQRQQQQLPHRRPSTSGGRSIAPIFPNDPDSIELKQYTRNLPQIHDDDDDDDHDDDHDHDHDHDHDDHDHDDHDDHLREGQATPDSCSHDDGNTNTGVTTPDLKGFPERVRRASFAAPSATTSTTAEHVDSRLSIFWANNISIVVPSQNARDHLALERTYLSYHRTSLILAILATVVAQLTVINHAPSPSTSFGFHALGKPLALVLASCAVISSIVGGLRWWRLQQGLLRGVGISGGAEILIIAGIVGAIIATTFGLVLAIDIDKEY